MTLSTPWYELVVLHFPDDFGGGYCHLLFSDS